MGGRAGGGPDDRPSAQESRLASDWSVYRPTTDPADLFVPLVVLICPSPLQVIYYMLISSIVTFGYKTRPTVAGHLIVDLEVTGQVGT